MIAALCVVMCLAFFGFAMVSLPTTVKADSSFTVESITYQFRETYNSNPGGQRTEYLFKFNAENDVLSGYENAAEITDMTDFGTSVKVNDTAIASATGGYKLYKEGKNLLKVVLGHMLGYVSFTLPKGLTIGGCTLAEDITLYQGIDGNFTATAPEYRVNALYVAALGTEGQATIEIAMTKSAAANKTIMTKVLINGTAFSECSDVVQDYWNDWDTGYAGYTVRYHVNQALLNAGMTITFQSGFSTNGTYETSEEQSFYFPAGDYGNWTIYNSLYAIPVEYKEFTVSEIKFDSRQVYNVDALGGIRTEYLFKLDAEGDVLAKYNKGDEIILPDFASRIKVNGTALDSVKLNSVNDVFGARYRLYKEDSNLLRVVIGRAAGYVSFTFPANLTIGGYVLKASVTYYQNTDGTFTTTAPDYNVNAIYVRPIYADPWVIVQFGTTASGVAGSGYTDKLIINGKKLSEYSEADGVRYYGNVVYWDNDYDDGYYGYHFTIYLSYSLLANGLTITVPKGFTPNGTLETAEERSFYFPAGDYSYTNWGNYSSLYARYYSSTAETNFAFVEKNDSGVTYKLSFTGTSDIFADFNKDADMTAFVKASDIPSHITLNGSDLSKYTVSYKKGEANEILVTVSGDLVPPTVTVSSGYVVNERKIDGITQIYSSNADYSLKSGIDETYVSKVTSTTSYGTMGKDVATRFTIELDDIGLFSSFSDGTDITSYLSSTMFTDNVSVNGSSLTDIKAARTISMYKRGKDAAVYPTNTNAIEIIISGAQIFDYDVTVNKGCVVGNVKVAETVTYRKNYNEGFDKLEAADTELKPIAIREIPYGNLTYRCFRVVFNANVSSVDVTTLKNNIKFSTADNENYTFDTSAGGYYFNGETELGGRSYMIYFYSSEYVNFVTSEGAKISIGSVSVNGTNTVATNFVMNNGTWAPEGYQGEIVKAEITEVRHPGNQDDGTKLFQFISSVAYNHAAFPTFLKENLYLNGKKIGDYKTGAGYVNVEIGQGSNVYDCKWFAIYLDDEIRNYEGGFDVLCLKAGAPLSGGRTYTEDQYFYVFQDRTQRDGAGNWLWTISKTAPALELLCKEEYKADGDNATFTVNFDRTVAKNDALFGKYSEVDVKEYIVVGGKKLSEYGSNASYEWTDNGIKITVAKTALGDIDLIDVTFKADFVTPLGYKFAKDATRYYKVSENVWASDFTVTKPQGSSVSVTGAKIEKVNVNGDKTAKKLTFTFSGNIVGNTSFEGTTTPVSLYMNITAPYADLIALTNKSFSGQGYGYNYKSNIIDRVVKTNLRNSVLDGVSVNGETLRAIIAAETGYVALENYPVRVDLQDNMLIIYVQSDSAIYSEIVDGVKIDFANTLTFECDNSIAADTRYVLNDGALAVTKYYKSITVKTTKVRYNQGQDLDFSKFVAYGVYNDDSKGANFTVTADMISGYDKNVVGTQTVTVTYEGCTATVEIEVLAVESGSTDAPEASDGGCGASISSALLPSVIFIALSLVFLGLRKLKKDDND